MQLANSELLRTDSFIAGQWQGANERFSVINPATSQVIAEVAEADVDVAIAAAVAAQADFAKSTAAERAAGIQSNAHACRRAIVRDAPIIRHKIVRGVFRRHATLHGKTSHLHILLRGEANFWISQRCALGDENLRFDDIDARDFLGHGVFDLDPRIDFDEIKLIGVAIDEEFHRASALVFYFVADR